MRIVFLPSATRPPRYVVLPPGAEVLKAGGRAYVVPKGGKLVREETDRWPPRFKVVFGDEGE